MWNHRVVESHYNGEPWFTIHEVHYDNGKPIARTENAIAPAGETIEDLKWELEQMLACLDKPILTDEEIEENNVRDREGTD
jgi:hypothetical protein